jgi:phospholipid/cholesterol/gamma-HCH transport system substrate-binding protein
MSRKKEIQVGLTVIIALAVLGWGLLWFKQAVFAGTVTVYQADFVSVGGLQSGDRVQVQGIRMGKVKDFVLQDGVVRVTFQVNDDAVLHEDAIVNLTSMGIVGELLLEIMPGTGAVAPENYLFTGNVMKDMNAMMSEGAETLIEARELTREISSFMEAIRGEGRLENVLDNTSAATSTLKTATEEIAPELKGLVADLRATSAAVNAAIAGPDSALAGVLTDAQVAAKAVEDLTMKLTETTESLAQIIQRLENGEGTVGRALQDDSLYAAAESTIVDMQDLIADMKARPKRYFHVSLF